MPDQTLSTYPVVPFVPYDKGIDLLTEKTLLPPGFVTDAKNVWFEPGIVKRRGGLTNRDDGTGLNDYIFGNLLWESGSGSVETIITNGNVYVFSVSAIATVTKGYTSIFNTDAAVVVPAFDKTTLPTLSWTLVPITLIPNASWLYFTDGNKGLDNVHTVYKFDGTNLNAGATAALSRADGLVDLSDLNGLVQPLQVGQIIYFADHLMVGNYTASAGQYKKTVAWGDKDDDDMPSGVGGDKGAKVLTDAEGEILRFIRLGAHLAIYLDYSIVICDPTPSNQIYYFDTRVQGIGLIAPNAVVDLGGIHIFVGQDNVYTYDGGLQPKPIGDRIIKEILNQLDSDKKGQVLAHYNPDRNLVEFFIPSHDTTWGRYYAAFNYKYGTWTHGRMGYEVSSVGYGLQESTILCSTEPWASETCVDGEFDNLSCNDFKLKAGHRSSVLGVTRSIVNSPEWGAVAYTTTAPDTVMWTDGKEYECIRNHTGVASGVEQNTPDAVYEGGTPTPKGYGYDWIPYTESNLLVDFREEGDLDLDVPITSYIELSSKPLGKIYGEFGRVLEILVESKGPSFALAYSTDLGETWTVAKGDIGGNDTFKTEVVTVDILSQFLTLKIILDNLNTNTQIRVLTATVSPASGRSLD